LVMIDIRGAAERLRAADDIWILIHMSPDGDALGCAFALWDALSAMGKRVAVLSPDPLAAMYGFLYPEGYEPERFEPRFILSVDLASPGLMGRYEELAPRVDLCIDHHPTNTGYARETCLAPTAAAAGETVLDVLVAMDAPISRYCADALYLAISSDTGGFRYASTTAETHRKAARLMEMGAGSAEVDRLLFESKPRALVAVEGHLMTHMGYYYDGLCAVIRLPRNLLSEYDLDDSDTDGISALPRKVQGVEAGVTLREREEGGCRVSLRTTHISACEICAQFGGGGHRLAAGCTIQGTLDEAEAAVVEAVGAVLEREGLLV